MLLSVLARHEQALAEIELARQCDPVSVPVNATISYVWCEARKPDRAVAAALKALELDSSAPLSHMLLGCGYMLLGELRKAIASLTTAARLSRDGPIIKANLGYVYARAGAPDKARRILEEITHRPSAAYVSPVDVALILIGLGETDAALTALEDGFRTRAARMLAVGDPFFAKLSGVARYRRLLADLHLPMPPPKRPHTSRSLASLSPSIACAGTPAAPPVLPAVAGDRSGCHRSMRPGYDARGCERLPSLEELDVVVDDLFECGCAVVVEVWRCSADAAKTWDVELVPIVQLRRATHESADSVCVRDPSWCDGSCSRRGA